LFEQHFGDALTWTTTLTDGSIMELRPNGAQQAVEFAERKVYARMAEWTRMHEGREQLQAVQRGLHSVLPASVLSLFSADEFERLVCGVPFVDVSLLRRHTEYSGCSAKDEHVAWFFTALEELSQEDLRKFLVFSYAQERMPSSDEEFTTRSGNKIRMLIKAATAKPGQAADERFISSDTCFWNISLPRYSSLAVTRRMLGLVLSLSSGMDGDEVDDIDQQRQDEEDDEEEQLQQQQRMAERPRTRVAHSERPSSLHPSAAAVASDDDGGASSSDDEHDSDNEDEEDEESDDDAAEDDDEEDRSSLGESESAEGEDDGPMDGVDEEHERQGEEEEDGADEDEDEDGGFD
jgi:other hect domain ubiquitin protein ligase E3